MKTENARTPAEIVAAVTGAPALRHAVAVYVPSTYRDKPAPAEAVEEAVAYTLREMSALFGGATAYTARGAWIDAHGALIEEAVTVCRSFAAAVTDDDAAAVAEIAARIREAMRQDAVTIEIDGAAGFIAG